MIYALAITGPTASGKTSLSIRVAKELGCEIISCDSMQIYKQMNIGTAKATPEEQAAIPHHLIDVISPSESFSAMAYRDMAIAAARDIAKRGKIPLFVGGTGLYLTTLVRSECDEVPASDPEYRRAIEEKISSEEDRISLHERLREVDPVSAEQIHYNNVRRVIRALEIYDMTGKPKSYFDEQSRKPSSDISISHITLDFHDREVLYRRADLRVGEMIAAGLEKEVKDLLDSGLLQPHYTSAQAIGYKEMIRAITKEASYDTAIAELKQATRNYAKRQLTWFRHDDSAIKIWADTEEGYPKSQDELLGECISVFKESLGKNKN